MATPSHTSRYDRKRIREGRPFDGLSRSAPSTNGVALRSSGYYVCAPVGIRLDKAAFETPLAALRPETLAMLKFPLR